MYFEQHKDEEIIEIIRKSFFLNFTSLFKSFSLLLPSVYVLLYIDIPIASLLAFFWMVAIFAYVLYNWLSWYYFAYVLTTDRIIEIKHKSLFAKEITEVPLSKISDASYGTEGFLSAILNYGTVKLQSDAAAVMELKSVPYPKETKQNILDLISE